MQGNNCMKSLLAFSQSLGYMFDKDLFKSYIPQFIICCVRMSRVLTMSFLLDSFSLWAADTVKG